MSELDMPWLVYDVRFFAIGAALFAALLCVVWAFQWATAKRKGSNR